MKKTYRAPVAKKIDYAFNEQIVATSIPINDHTDWHKTGKVCTWGPTKVNCSTIYNVPLARGLNDCLDQGDVPLD